MRTSKDRRKFLKTLAGLSAAMTFTSREVLARKLRPITKAIPVSDELLPVVGMGSSRTFDVKAEESVLNRLTQVLQAFFDNGGALVDSSPMYGAAEQVIGDLLKRVRRKQSLFAATKVWTDGRQQGIEQMQRSMQRVGVKVFDLMQIHNLRDWQTHLETLIDWKAQGKIRYIGITTSHGRFHDELETILETESFDFVQFSYNIANRDVEQRLLPQATEYKIAVIVNRPYQRGELFLKVKGKPLPNWATEIDCNSWGQFFLKFIISHPGVTCVIPATSKVHHMTDNMGAGFGRLPGPEMRNKMRRYYESL